MDAGSGSGLIVCCCPRPGVSRLFPRPKHADGRAQAPNPLLGICDCGIPTRLVLLSFVLTFVIGIVYNLVMDTKKKSTDYFKLVQKEFAKLEKLRQRRDDLDVEIAKAKQFIAATANMLNDRQRDIVLQLMGTIEAGKMIAEAGLTEAIRSVLKKNYKRWLTVTQVRDRLESAGFDFSSYKSSPLASISTTLKRFKAEDVETAEIDGVAAYRWIGKILGTESSKGSAFYGEPARMGTLAEMGNLAKFVEQWTNRGKK